ncbi:MAG: UDP-3-O-acyl-N-acetylglucosamine deacetylase [Rhodobacteraceae bacterium]|uniref:UDP-3-O-acyl-N-acetylglucosamine deacetylase n=1 Tax=Amaricoccus sp. B4 TaxID=3368557 RepID=UPI000DAD4482|nr:UDP-3-O-acyl-N-acetylglucosamine deacetylase [Paracoccaceae bacterium]
MHTTLEREITLRGTGLHSGRPVRLTLHPATEGGIRFRRVDVTDRDNIIPARYDAVTDTTLCTVLSNEAGISVSTVEHIMAAFAGLGVSHVLVDIDGPEVPILDGSSQRFVKAILKAGLRQVAGDLRAIRILKPVRDVQGDVVTELTPAPMLSIDFEIDFPDAAIGHQEKTLDMLNGSFVRELSDCRTFCRRAEVEAMQAHGLALGGSLDNAVVVEGEKVLNPGGFRRADECVRHKMLDAMGDLALAGAPILGAYRGVKAGHGATNRLLRRLFATPDAFEWVVLDEEQQAVLPGAGVGLADLRRAG